MFIDVDGTLTDDISAWEKVHHTFDLVDEMNINTERFFAGEIDYNTWAKEDVALWKGKSYHDFKRALMNPKLREGAIEGVELLKRAGFDVILVSGGIDEMVQQVASAVKADQYYANTIGHTNGILDGSVHINVGNSKSDIIQQIASENNYNLNHCGAIGDNTNDIGMFEIVAYSVAINTDKQEVIEAANDLVITENFAEAANKIILTL